MATRQIATTREVASTRDVASTRSAASARMPTEYLGDVGMHLTSDLLTTDGRSLFTLEDNAALVPGTGLYVGNPDPPTEGGHARIPNTLVGLDVESAWWVGIEVIMGGAYDAMFCDLFNFSMVPDPPGKTQQAGASCQARIFVIDYYHTGKRLNANNLLYRHGPGFNNVARIKDADIPDFAAGDTLRAVIGYDPSTTTLSLWAQFISASAAYTHTLKTASDTSTANAFNAADEAIVYFSVGPAFWDYIESDPAPINSDSHYRELVIKQEACDGIIAASYISDPTAYVNNL